MSGALYVDGKKLCDIGELEFFSEPVRLSETEKAERIKKIQEESREFPINLAKTLSFTCTLKEVHLSQKAWWFFFTGKWPSNNWFKMHGGIMERKVQIAKAGNLMQRKGKRKHGKGKCNNPKGIKNYREEKRIFQGNRRSYCKS